MLELALLFILLFTIVSIVLIEFIYNARTKAKKEKELQESIPKEPVEPEPHVQEIVEEEIVVEVVAKKVPEQIIEEVVVEEPEPEIVELPEEEVTIEAPEEIPEEVEPEEEKPAKDLPLCEYPEFTHVRLIEMGLSDDEAKEFVNELIPQLEEQIPLIEASMNDGDFHQVERLTHGIKGSATNIGTGGVSDLLVEFNTYVKSGDDIDIVKAYYQHFINYTAALKEQYS